MHIAYKCPTRHFLIAFFLSLFHLQPLWVNEYVVVRSELNVVSAKSLVASFQQSGPFLCS